MSARRYRKVMAVALVASVGLSLAACSSDESSSGRVTITVDCPPLKTDNGGKSLEQWNKDVAAFEAANPNVDLITISVGAQCNNPPDFTARLQGGTQADVFYGYMTDLGQVLDANAAEEITQYVNAETIPNWDSVLDSVKNPFIEDGKLYGIGYAGYTMGLVYNKNLFTQAGLDPNKPPTTWQEVAAAAKTISEKVPGTAGLLRVQRRQHRWLALHRIGLLPRQLAGVGGRQEGKRPDAGGQGRPADAEGHAVQGQQRR